MTKQWTSTWPYIANAFSELYKIMVKIVTFVGFRGGDRPNCPPLPITQNLGTRLGIKDSLYILAHFL